MSNRQRLAVVAVGGNSLIIDNEHRSIPDQFEAASSTVHSLMEMIEAGWNLVLTHGNGPQVGFILRRSEIAIDEVPPVPMDYATGDTQGSIGWMFQRAFNNEFRHRNIDRRAIAVVTQVLVDHDDPALLTPTKPIGSLFDESRANLLASRHGWTVKEDSGRGWRRVVPSPAPKAILELEVIKSLMGMGHVVIACGGGGIPVVVDDSGDYQGVEAVVDKDLASSLLARGLDADLFVISTGVEKVALGFNTPDQRWLDSITVKQAREYLARGEFEEGSMEPKVRAIIEYLEGGGTEGVITDPKHISLALDGKAGTRIVLDGD